MSDWPYYIKSVEVKGLWDRFDLEWNLHKDINILAGINGSGKTTLLKLIGYGCNWEILSGQYNSSARRINEDSNDLSFLDEKDRPIEPHQLSSGEKQLLIIFLKALIQDRKCAVMIMDEPEISLHMDWQETLISNIAALNPNAQLIIATHSPDLILEGYEDKIFEMNDLIIADREK